MVLPKEFTEPLCAVVLSLKAHGSGNTKAVSDYCVDFAQKRNLEYQQDAHNNVIIIKPATSGYEEAAPLILQGHLDMVCEKAPGCSKDMTKEGLDLVAEGDLVYAKGTTLGGDDGIAVAMALAALDDESLVHPRLEAVFTIDEEVGMWSVGTTYFVTNAEIDKKKVLKNVLTHPCLVAIYLGIFCMLTQIHLPKVITETVRYIGNCNSALTMFTVGTILADVKLSTIFNRDTTLFSILRLAILPALAFGLGSILQLDSTSLGISVLMTGMPAGATAAIFAARYNSDAPFATKCVVMTTLVSMLTLPVWCYLVG